MDKATVIKTAELARLELSESEIEPTTEKMAGVMAFIEEMNNVDTDGVEPYSVVGLEAKTREDVVNDGGNPEAVLSNAPEEKEGYYVVRKIIE